jgi:hypothetical protein
MHSRRLASLALIASLALGACAVSPDKPVTQVSQPMTVSQARQTVMDIKKMQAFSGTSAGASLLSTDDVTVGRDGFSIDGRHYRFQDIAPAISAAHFDSTPSFLVLDSGMAIDTGGGERGNKRAQQLADALLTLKAASTPEALALEQQHFDAIVQQYRSADPKPAVSEDMRRYEIQAEAAVQDKQFEQAADLYDQALAIAPWWPQAHFNRALILETLGEYDLAIDEMQRYLKLAPDAANARAAQDKIYQWQLKVPVDAATPAATGSK